MYSHLGGYRLIRLNRTDEKETLNIFRFSVLHIEDETERGYVPPGTRVSRRVTGDIRPKLEPEMSWPSKNHYVIRPPPQAAVPPGTRVSRRVTGGIRPTVGP